MQIIAAVGTIVTHSEVAGLHPNTLLLGMIGETGVPTGVVRVARDVRAGRPTVDPYMVVYVPPKPAPKVGDTYRDRQELNEARLPVTAVILDSAGDVARRDDVRGDSDDWTSIDEGEGCGLVGPIRLLHLPGKDS